ncbi:MAG TPA: hypothetical protein VNO31_31310 [Umezawaea sp.]|nr:hypothetical protein [Umezawaea sp.]
MRHEPTVDELGPREHRLALVLAAQPATEFDLAVIETAYPIGPSTPTDHDDHSTTAPASSPEHPATVLGMLDRLSQAGFLTRHETFETSIGLGGVTAGPRWTVRMPVRQLALGQALTQDAGEYGATVARVADLVWRVLHDADRVVTGYRRHPHQHPSGPPGSPVFTDRGQALAWLTTHGHVVGDYAEALADLGQHERAWHLIDGLWPLFLYVKDRPWRARMHALGLAAAQSWGDPEAQAEMHTRLGMDATASGRHADADGHLHTALALRENLADHLGAAHVRMMLGRLGIAIAEHLDANPTADGAHTRATALGEAETELHRALTVYRENKASREMALTQHLLGEHAAISGHVEEALELLGRAQIGFDALENPDPYNAARARAAAGRILTRLGRVGLAKHYLGEALESLRTLGSDAEANRVVDDLAALAATHDCADHRVRRPHRDTHN